MSRYQRGSLRKEADRWILRRRVDGKEQRLVVGLVCELRSEGAARREADAKLEAMQEGARQAGERISLHRFAPIFLEDICARLKPSTRAAYESAFRQHLLPLFGTRSLIDITQRELTHLAAELHRRERSPKTIRAVCAVLAVATHRAIDHGYAANRLDLEALRLGAMHAVAERRRIFTRQEVSRIIEAAVFPWRALYALLAYTGMRCGEALGLDWRCVDFEAAHLQLRQAACMGRIQAMKSRGSEATLPMPGALAQELRAYRAQYDADRNGELPLLEEQLLFPSPHDPRRPIWSAGVRHDHFGPLLKRLQIEHAGLHAFRHFFATEALREGTAPTVVKELLRHSNINITLGYTHVTRSDQRTASDAVAQAIEGAT